MIKTRDNYATTTQNFDNQLYSTVAGVCRALGLRGDALSYVRLADYCAENELPVLTINDDLGDELVKVDTYPTLAWWEVYGADLARIHGPFQDSPAMVGETEFDCGGRADDDNFLGIDMLSEAAGEMEDVQAAYERLAEKIRRPERATDEELGLEQQLSMSEAGSKLRDIVMGAPEVSGDRKSKPGVYRGRKPVSERAPPMYTLQGGALVDTERVEGGIRVYVDENGERWYCAHDVCQLTGHVNMSDAFSLRRGRAKFYDRIKLPTANGRGRANMVYIKAATVVELIGKSVKPHAASLMDWFVEVAK